MKKERFKKVLKAFKKRSFYVFIFCNLFATFLHFACNITSEIDNELKDNFMNISKILYDEIENYNIDINLKEDIDLIKYFKLVRIEFENEYRSLFDKFIDILEVYSELYDQTLIFINALSYFTNEEINEILKYITYKKISVLFLENSYNRSVYFENEYIIDNDFYDYTVHNNGS